MTKSLLIGDLAKLIVLIALAVVTVKFDLNRLYFAFALVPAFFLISIIEGEYASTRGGARIFIASAVIFIVGYGVALLCGYSFIDLVSNKSVGYLVWSVPFTGISLGVFGLLQLLIGFLSGRHKDNDES